MGTPIRVLADGGEAVKRSRGRPPKPMPNRIDASPERIAQTILSRATKRDLRYVQLKRFHYVHGPCPRRPSPDRNPGSLTRSPGDIRGRRGTRCSR